MANRPTRGPAAMSEDEIDETLEGSFPASDPPSWTLGTDHRKQSENTEDSTMKDGLRQT